jgi:hypothetical protein
MKRIVLALAVLLVVAVPLQAQVVINFAQSRVEFTSTDHDTLVPVGQVGAGTPLVATYQGFVVLNGSNPAVGSVVTSPVIPRAAVTTLSGASPNQVFSLTFAQLGITATTLPACSVIAPLLCPAYQVVLIADGPAGQTARGVGAASDSFSLAAQVLPTKPAPPSLVKVKAS